MMRSLRAAAIACMCALTLNGQSGGQPNSQARGGETRQEAGTYRIAGVVVDANSGAPLNRVDVALAPAGSPPSVTTTTTGEDGSFVFEGLRAGKYPILASRRGYQTAAYEEHQDAFSTAIVTGEGLDTSHLRFQLRPNAILGGAVIDDAGDPVPGATVTLYRQNSADIQGGPIRMRTDTTDDAGAFEFTRLEAGIYFVSASARPWYAFHPQLRVVFLNGTQQQQEAPRSSLDVAYPITFYADATDSNAATPIVLKAGDHPQINLTMHAVAAVQLRVKVPEPPADANGAPTRGFVPPLLTQPTFGRSENTTPTVASLGTADGQRYWEISGLAPGAYTLQFPSENGQGQGAGSAEIDLAGDQVLDHSSVAAGVEVSGTLGMAFGAKPPENLNVTLAPVDGRNGDGQKVSPDGTFTFHGVAPGAYALIVAGGGRQLPVLRIRTAGREIEGDRIQVGSDPVTFSVTAAEGSVTLNGFAKRNGQGLGGTMVVLVPRHPRANPYLFRRDQSDSDGSFSLYRIVPGHYTLIAIDDGWELEWAREGVLQKYLAQGMQLDIREDATKIDLPEPVAVQVR